MTDRSLFVAALQTAGVVGDPAATLARFEDNTRAFRATFDGLQLVVAPELHLMALPPLLEEAGVSEHGLAVDVPGELTARLGELARETRLWLIPASVYERVGDAVANTALVLSPDGELVASYRKDATEDAAARRVIAGQGAGGRCWARHSTRLDQWPLSRERRRLRDRARAR